MSRSKLPSVSSATALSRIALGAGMALFAATGCGVLADALGDAASVDIDSDLFPEMTLGDNYVQPLTFSAEASHTSPTFSLPDVPEAAMWGPVIAAHNDRLDAGEEGLFAYDVQDFALDTLEGVYFTVDVYSRDGVVVSDGSVASLGTSIATCDFLIDVGADATAFGGHMTACLSDWVRANGIPMQLGFDVTAALSSTRAVANEFTMTNTSYMLASHNVEVEPFQRQLKIDGEVVDNADIIAMDNLGIKSTARWEKLAPVPDDPNCTPEDGALSVFGFGSVIDTREGETRTTFGKLVTRMTDARDYNYSVETNGAGTPTVLSDYDSVTWRPAMPEWMSETLDIGIAVKAAAADPDAEVSVPVRGFYVVAGHCPRVGVVNFKLQGTAHFEVGGN